MIKKGRYYIHIVRDPIKNETENHIVGKLVKASSTILEFRDKRNDSWTFFCDNGKEHHFRNFTTMEKIRHRFGWIRTYFKKKWEGPIYVWKPIS